MPLLLYLTVAGSNNDRIKIFSETSIEMLITIIIILLVTVHCANASMVQRYFTLVEDERDFLFGKEIKRQDRRDCLVLDSRGFI